MPSAPAPAIPPIPSPDKKKEDNPNNLNKDKNSHPPSPRESQSQISAFYDSKPKPPGKKMNRDEIRFLADVAGRPMSTTVSRYQRLHLSRRRGNAIRLELIKAKIIESVTIATRSGQVILCQITDIGRRICNYLDIEPGNASNVSLAHRYWTHQAQRYFEKKGYEVHQEFKVEGNGFIDLLAERPGERVAIEIETGKSDIENNLKKLTNASFDRIILVATSAHAVTACTRARDKLNLTAPMIELLTWLDMG